MELRQLKSNNNYLLGEEQLPLPYPAELRVEVAKKSTLAL
jgi:hypothetical protein